jgi:hypothetical protein
VTNILEIFFCFSSFSQLHGILLTNKVGDTTMRIVDLEIKRYELKAQERGAAAAKKNAKYFQKQERLLFVCFYILLNLAEDTAVELKMKNRNIMWHLVAMLQRTNTDRKFLDELHLLIVTFLKKLSIFTENKVPHPPTIHFPPPPPPLPCLNTFVSLLFLSHIIPPLFPPPCSQRSKRQS